MSPSTKNKWRAREGIDEKDEKATYANAVWRNLSIASEKNPFVMEVSVKARPSRTQMVRDINMSFEGSSSQRAVFGKDAHGGLRVRVGAFSHPLPIDESLQAGDDCRLQAAHTSRTWNVRRYPYANIRSAVTHSTNCEWKCGHGIISSSKPNGHGPWRSRV